MKESKEVVLFINRETGEMCMRYVHTEPKVSENEMFMCVTEDKVGAMTICNRYNNEMVPLINRMYAVIQNLTKKIQESEAPAAAPAPANETVETAPEVPAPMPVPMPAPVKQEPVKEENKQPDATSN